MFRFGCVPSSVICLIFHIPALALLHAEKVKAMKFIHRLALRPFELFMLIPGSFLFFVFFKPPSRDLWTSTVARCVFVLAAQFPRKSGWIYELKQHISRVTAHRVMDLIEPIRDSLRRISHDVRPRRGFSENIVSLELSSVDWQGQNAIRNMQQSTGSRCWNLNHGIERWTFFLGRE